MSVIMGNKKVFEKFFVKTPYFLTLFRLHIFFIVRTKPRTNKCSSRTNIESSRTNYIFNTIVKISHS